ncbi:Gfo/Idh/MocA family oxidoreductase [uncultured Tenacibaculum sp.]|uniref:Gfo/Idh/MocA family protein n=1 Tax=uncultured Tenacibaculum sp. TaxID=174713 RepID=UPI002629D2A3|nr:Gfo/Idh/MocA family oxidoreductase [uncultured Tenacibaculum sp.]
MNRKNFIQSLLGASAFISMPFSSYANDNDALLGAIKATSKPTKGNLFGFKASPIKKVKVGIIGLGNRGTTLLQMYEWLAKQGYCEIVALSDLQEKKVQKAADSLSKWQKKKPNLYFGDKNEWQKLAKQDDIDLLLITTPWELHTPMCIYGMNQGKHVACEVPIAYTLSECWELIEAAERNQKHCIMIENCCYNEEELFVLNMIENGVFGDITHTEGAYLHDLRAHMLSSDYYEDQWRLKHHIERDGNFYTTHGLGPISFYLNIGRGDTFDHLTSMSSRELNLSETAKRLNSPYTNFKCGDMNSTMIKTAKGKSILLQFDVHTGRPYSRINKVVGTKATHDGYPSRLYIDKEELAYWGHQWLSKDDYQSYSKKYTHPIIKKLKTISQSFKQGHGGMDFVMMYRLIRCLNLGLPLDINAYDSVMWSAITPLSEISVASKSLSIPIPDFTNGQWKRDTPLEIMRDI